MSRTSHTSHTLIPQSCSWTDEFLCTCRTKILVRRSIRSYKRDLLHCCNFADTGPSLQWSPFQFQMYRSNNHFHRSQPQRSWEEPRRRLTELGSSYFVVFSALVVAMLTWTGLWVFKSGSQIYSEQRRVQPGSEVDFSISPLWPLCFWVTLFHLGDFLGKWILKHQAPRFSF